MQRVLLTFVGFHDPYSRSAVDGVEMKGPILYLLDLRPFDRVYLFSAPNTLDIARATAEAIGRQAPGTQAVIQGVDISDPISYGQILAGLRSSFAAIRADNRGAEYSIATSSGTPQMHASWLLLAAGGEIPAKVLQTRPPRFVTARNQAVEEVDLEALGGVFGPEPAGGRGVRPALSRPDQAAVGVDELLRQELGIVGQHPVFVQAMDKATQLGPHAVPVLIHGETGTGKELVARYVHRLSGRPAERIEPFNCAALPRDLAESVLFGHRKGAFTGAVADQQGLFERADGGTLFLDEIGELPLDTQAKLLRVLEDGVVQPLGASGGRKVNVRIVAATNRDLRVMVKDRGFREDLYYRIEVGLVHLPPLRERRSDIALLAVAAMENINKPLKHPRSLSRGALEALTARDWPGNVRALFNVLERSAIFARGEVMGEADLQFSDDGPATIRSLPEPHEGFDLEGFLDGARRHLFDRALELSGDKPTAAARLLGITPQAVFNYVRRGGVSTKPS